MDKNLQRFQVALLVLYYLTFFMTVYTFTFMGQNLKTSIGDLQAGNFFKLFYLAVVAFMIYTLFMNHKLQKIAFRAGITFMVLLSLILILLKDPTYSLRFAWYFQALIIALVVMSRVRPKLTSKWLEKGIDLCKELILKTGLFVDSDKKQEE